MSTPNQSSKFDLFQEELLDDSESPSSSKTNTVSWRSRELSFAHTPSELPENIQPPKYAIGDRCRWIPMNTTDWGTIIGQVFAPVESVPSTTPQWSWLYLVLLGSDSPSRQWVITDWAEEDDLERFCPPA